MRRQLVWAALFLGGLGANACAPADDLDENPSAIEFGKPVSDPKQAPGSAAIHLTGGKGTEGGKRCSATLVAYDAAQNKSQFVTAAHCLHEPNGQPYQITAVSSFLDADGFDALSAQGALPVGATWSKKERRYVVPVVATDVRLASMWDAAAQTYVHALASPPSSLTEERALKFECDGGDSQLHYVSCRYDLAGNRVLRVRYDSLNYALKFLPDVAVVELAGDYRSRVGGAVRIRTAIDEQRDLKVRIAGWGKAFADDSDRVVLRYGDTSLAMRPTARDWEIRGIHAGVGPTDPRRVQSEREPHDALVANDYPNLLSLAGVEEDRVGLLGLDAPRFEGGLGGLFQRVRWLAAKPQAAPGDSGGPVYAWAEDGTFDLVCVHNLALDSTSACTGLYERPEQPELLRFLRRELLPSAFRNPETR